MIGEAVSTFRGDVAEGQTELRLELPVDAHIPEDVRRQRAAAARGVPEAVDRGGARARRTTRSTACVEELTDRYGEPPVPVLNLVAVSRLRRLAQKAGLSEVVAMGGNLRVAPAELPDSMQVRLQRLYPGARLFVEAKALSVPMLAGIANPQDTDAGTDRLGGGSAGGAVPVPAPATAGATRWLRSAARRARVRDAASRLLSQRGAVSMVGGAALRPIEHPRQQHERAQVDDRVDRDDEQDRPAHDVDERQQPGRARSPRARR